MIEAYRVSLGLFLGGACRFTPSCSEYAAEAFRTHPLGTAFRLSYQRVLKCHPRGPFGYDPVPENHSARGEHEPA